MTLSLINLDPVNQENGDDADYDEEEIEYEEEEIEEEDEEVAENNAVDDDAELIEDLH